MIVNTCTGELACQSARSALQRLSCEMKKLVRLEFSLKGSTLCRADVMHSNVAGSWWWYFLGCKGDLEH